MAFRPSLLPPERLKNTSVASRSSVIKHAVIDLAKAGVTLEAGDTIRLTGLAKAEWASQADLLSRVAPYDFIEILHGNAPTVQSKFKAWEQQ